MLYEEFIVERAEPSCHQISDLFSQRRVTYDLRSRSGQRVSFCLILAGCVGQDHYWRQYEAIRHHMIPGAYLSCRIAYTWRNDHFAMGMSSFSVLGDYLPQAEGYSGWPQVSRVVLEVDIPGVIEFYGDAHIPFSGGYFEHVSDHRKHARTLQWIEKQSFLLRIIDSITKLFTPRPSTRTAE